MTDHVDSGRQELKKIFYTEHLSVRNLFSKYEYVAH